MKVSQLIYNDDTDCFELDGEELQCGDCISVLIYNGISDKAEWIETRIEHDGSWYYLVGLIGYQISGLFARR